MSHQTSGENRLAKEKSPYLLQHKNNPVDWYPWGDEAFQKAKTEDKPIFLSIGYSTCYWCHMMEKDSFELQEVADALNKDFVSIKVDREEHPEVDQIYMDAVIGMIGHGGWPLSVFLTPERKPFFGGTFFWRQQFLELLQRIHSVWESDRQKVFESGEQVLNFLKEKNRLGESGGIEEDWLAQAFGVLQENFDPEHGGFGRAPKFLHSLDLSLLLRIYRRSHEIRALQIVTKSLDEMARGQIYDRIGGGFHRYATREDWNEPHYEKMLYDNALLASTYLEAYQVTQNKLYSEVVTQTLDYILREMTDPEGGFYSAQDAGEVGKEGEYYHLNKEERSRHIPPHKDDKILVSWNGLMIASLAKGYQVLGEERYLIAAQKAARMIQKNLYKKDRLLRLYREGPSRLDGSLDDYAFLIHGLIGLHQSDFDPDWISWAVELQKGQDELFWNETEKIYSVSPPDSPTLLIRKNEVMDGVLPAGNSLTILNLLRLQGLTFDQNYGIRARQILSSLAGIIPQAPHAFSQALIGVDYLLDRSHEVALILPDKETGIEILSDLRKRFLPNQVISVSSASKAQLPHALPIVRGKTVLQNRPTAYVCEERMCQAPTTDPEKIKSLVAEHQPLKMRD